MTLGARPYRLTFNGTYTYYYVETASYESDRLLDAVDKMAISGSDAFWT